MGGSVRTGQIGVLIVDDKADVRHLLRMTLEPDARFTIVGEAGDGVEAIDQVIARKPDVALLDLAMPHMDGLQAIRQIRERSPETRIIVLSGYAASFMSGQVIGQGADAYVQKGTPPGVLIAEILKLFRDDDESVEDSTDGLPETTAGTDPAPTVRTNGRRRPVVVRPDSRRSRMESPAGPHTARADEPILVAAVEASVDAPPTVRNEDPMWELLSFLIHEMQGSLTVIGGFASTLRVSAEKMDQAGILGCVEPIERNAKNLSDLVRQLADVRAMETKVLEMQLEDTGPGGLVRTTVADLSMVTNPHPVRVEVIDAPMTKLDPLRIRQVLTNLLSNAAKFSPSESPIEVTVRRRGTDVEISVTDRCGGLPAERVGELFGKFSRLGSSVKGTGLGLYLSRGIARAHGGDLRHESAPGGCRFVLSLPLPPGSDSQLTVPVQTGRVLVVDDEPDLSMLIEHHLKGQGLEVHVAGDGQTAFDMATRLQPDLILLDVMMRGMDGYEVCGRLREDPRTANAFIIMLTARVQTEDRMLGLTAGADEYLTKPFDPEELVARVKAALRRVREMRALSPLTGLPGNIHIQQRIEHLVSEGRPFALLYADLDHFKAYNDRFGFVRGDRAIQAFAATIREAVDEVTPGEFVGHVGGDDFVIIVPPDDAERVALTLCDHFDARVLSLYDAEDLERGYIEVPDRRGEPQRYPLLTLSVGVTSTANRSFEHFGEAVTVATEMKQFAKRESGSSYAIDRRTG